MLTEPLLTGAELADLLKVHERTVRRMRARGDGPPAFKFAGGYRYAVADVMAWLESIHDDPTAAPGNEGENVGRGG